MVNELLSALVLVLCVGAVAAEEVGDVRGGGFRRGLELSRAPLGRRSQSELLAPQGLCARGDAAQRRRERGARPLGRDRREPRL